MKNLLRLLAASSLFAGLLVVAAKAGPLKEARVTQVVNDVKLLPEQAQPRPAAVSDKVVDGIAVTTGVESRSELTFTDQTLTRLGATTIFSFRQGTRTINVSGDGAVLLNVPKNSGGAKINSAAVTAAISGTTVVLETHNFPKDAGYHPDSDFKNAWYKFLVLEGESRFCRKNHKEDCLLVHAGEMLMGRADQPLGHVIQFDINQFMQTYVLTTGFQSPLPPGVLALIAAAGNQQSHDGSLVDANSITIETTPPGITVGSIQTINNTLGTINPANTGAQVNSPEKERVLICHNGHTISVPAKDAEKYLKNHPGDTLGPCPNGD